MKNFILILITVFTLVGCEDSHVSKGRKLYKAYLHKHMKDASSLIIYNESYEKDGYKIKWTVDFGGKNSFGGMNRETMKFETINGIIFTEDGAYKLENLK